MRALIITFAVIYCAMAILAQSMLARSQPLGQTALDMGETLEIAAREAADESAAPNPD